MKKVVDGNKACAEAAYLFSEIASIYPITAEIEAQLLTQEGTEFDKDNGILTLKSKGGTNDVQVQFNFNFGRF